MIVKPATGRGSLRTTEKYVCHNPSELKEQIAMLKSKTPDDIIVEVFIVGQEISVMVHRSQRWSACHDSDRVRISGRDKLTQKFLHYKNKFGIVDQGTIKFKLYDGDLMDRLKETACRAYRAIDVFGCRYAGIDIRASGEDLYVLGVNSTPTVYKVGNDFGDDYMISGGFSGSHEGFMETLIKTKLRFIQMLEVTKTYDLLSDK